MDSIRMAAAMSDAPKITARELYDLISAHIPTGPFEVKYCWVDGDIVFEDLAEEINALIARKVSGLTA
jgi:hypothetical protein